jgi:hypothetical protein
VQQHLQPVLAKDRIGSFEKDKLVGLFTYSLRQMVDNPEHGTCKQATALHVLCECTVIFHVNTLGTGDADLRVYRVLQSFGSYVTNARRVTQICVFTRGWIPRTLHLITQYMEPFFE